MDKECGTNRSKTVSNEQFGARYLANYQTRSDTTTAVLKPVQYCSQTIQQVVSLFYFFFFWGGREVEQKEELLSNQTGSMRPGHPPP